MYHTIRVVSVCFLSLAFALFVFPENVLAQAKLPANWQQMSPAEFAAAVRVLTDQDAFGLLSVDDEYAAKVQGKRFFLELDLANAEISYQTIESLHWLSRNDLAADVIDRTKAALLARNDDWTDRPYADLRAKLAVMNRLHFDSGTLVAEAQRWVAAGGTKEQIPASDLRFDLLRQIFTDLRAISGAFSVEWNGFVTAPKSGNYVFSISPINVNSRNPYLPFKVSMTVSVGGKVILISTPDSELNETDDAAPLRWVSSAAPLSLVAGQPVALKVTTSIDTPGIPKGMFHAILNWQGPGIAESIVPASNLTQTSSGKPGLQATYTWKVDGQPQALTRVESNIDASWSKSPIYLSQNVDLATQASEEMWKSLTSRAFLESYTATPSRMHPFLETPENASAGLTTARRAEFLRLLQQQPALLDSLNPKFMVSFYQSFRIGTPETALDVFGLWANRQADLICATVSLGSEFDADTRTAAGMMAMLTTQQLPGHVTRLQNEYLELQDGRCSLPVAYTLAMSYLGRQKLDEWIAFLDAKLADSVIAGDLRVNWLIARAHAEEIRYSPPSLNQNWSLHQPTRSLDGQVYLEQALRSAKSPDVIARVAKEIAVRLAWGGQAQAAQDLLTKTSSSLPADQQAKLATTIAQVARQITSQADSVQRQSDEAQKTYLSVLKQRRDLAAAKGDTAAVQRYEDLISNANQKSR